MSLAYTLRCHFAVSLAVLSGLCTQSVRSPSPGCSASLRLFESVTDLEKYVANVSSRLLLYDDLVLEESVMATASVAVDDSADSSGAGDSESVTNNQEKGVDEGGIVKAHGDFLIVLRRGRIFTVRLGAGTFLETVSVLDAFGPGTEPASWYDEILVIDRIIVVIGFSYHGAGATELGLFSIDQDGQLAYQNSYHLSSNDYYSARNYASRLVDSKLVLYMPHYLLSRPRSYSKVETAEIVYPKFGLKARDDDWSDLVAATDIYAPLAGVEGPVLHTVITCSLVQEGSSPALHCKARGILGPAGRVFYVSPYAVYVWTVGTGSAPSVVYRLPLDGLTAPSALRASGAPVDQLSFKEEDMFLSVLVRSDAVGEAMWDSEVSSGSVALMRVPLTIFQPGSYCITGSEHFKQLPTPAQEGGGSFQNRHVGDFVLYGMGTGWGSATMQRSGSVYLYNRRAGAAATELQIAHSVDRIEALGENAIVIGSDGADLCFTMVALGNEPQLAGRLVRKDAAQGETRTHGFFYKAGEDGTGMLGLPLRGAEKPGWSHLLSTGSSILYLSVEQHGFSRLGELTAMDEGGPDNCAASCTDWYGNSRPLFYRGRVFALLGYELVEGRIVEQTLAEIGRIHLFPEAQVSMASPVKSMGTWVIMSSDGSITQTFSDRTVPTASGARESRISIVLPLLLANFWCIGKRT